jgi:hypothetical protein
MRVPEAEAMAPTSRTEAGSALIERRMKAEEISIRRLNFSSLHREESQTMNRKALEKVHSGDSSDRETQRHRSLSIQRFLAGRELGSLEPQIPVDPKVTGALSYDFSQTPSHIVNSVTYMSPEILLPSTKSL